MALKGKTITTHSTQQRDEKQIRIYIFQIDRNRTDIIYVNKIKPSIN